jgi:hypothetical protein
MALPGLLIEYLITGAIALIWLYPLIERAGYTQISASNLSLAVPALYVAGMVIDFAAYWLTKPLKKVIRERVEKQYRLTFTGERGTSVARLAKFTLYAPELAKEVGLRSSRDRIARGAIVNMILITIFVTPVWGGLLIVASGGLWWGLEFKSHAFELMAEKELDAKFAAEQTLARGAGR